MKKKRSLSITTQVRGGMLVAIVVSLFITGGTLGYFSFQAQLSQQRAIQSADSRATAEKINSYIDDLERHLNYLARITGLSTFDASIQQNLLDGLVNSNRAYETVGLVDERGHLLAGASVSNQDIPSEWAETVSFRRAFQEEEDFIGPVELSTGQDWPTLIMATPIRDSQNKVDGMLFAKVNLKFLWAILAETKVGESGYAYVLSRRNLVIARSGGLPDYFTLEDLSQKPIAKINFPDSGIDPQTYRGLYDTPVLGSVANASSANWRVVIELPLTEAYAPAFSYLLIIGLGLVFSNLAALAWGTFISRQITKPLEHLTQSATRFSKGQLDTRVVISQENELKTLADAFNFMAGNLQEVIVDLRQQITERKQAEEELTRINRLYATISHIDQAIVHSKDRDTLFSEICNVTIEHGKFRMAWVGLIDHVDGRVKPVVFAGEEQGYLKNVNIVADDPILGSGPTGTAIREGRCIICDDIASNPLMAPWSEPAIQRGYGSSASVPIKQRGLPIGALTVYAADPNGFSDEDQKLLDDIGQDISHALDSMDAEEALRLSEERSRAVINTIPDLLFEIDRDGLILDFNTTNESLLYAPPSTFLGKNMKDVLPQNIAQLAMDKIEEALTSKKMTLFEYDLSMAEGQRYYENRLLALTDRTVLSVIRDITERKQVEDQINQLNTNLEKRVQERTTELIRANRAKDEFLANMSHELRTPLNSVLGFSESLIEGVRGPLTEPQEHAVQLIHNSGEHLLGLINDILDVSKIDAGKLELHPEFVDINQICKSSLTLIKQFATKKSIAVEYLPVPTASTIHADPKRLKQILVNLLNNAVKFTPEKGKVTLDVQIDAAQGQIRFSVIDTGIGISADDMEKLFKPFVQLSGSLSRQYEGTGLGLVLVQQLVEMHGGMVEVQSEVGKGSSFTVVLPWKQNPDHANEDALFVVEDKPQNSPPSLAAPTSGNGARILFAEDNETNVMVVKDYLEAHGYQVFVARNGEEALAKVDAISPALILMDVQMPEMNGLEATRRIRARPGFASVPIIALTALAMPGDRERCLEAGMDDYLSKPVKLKLLKQRIEELVKRTVK